MISITHHSRIALLAALALASLPACNGTATPGDAAQDVAVTLQPPSIQILPGTTQVFAAAVTGSANTSVSWTVQEGPAAGNVNASGVYTAPASTGTYHVVATSQADPTKSAVASVVVIAAGALDGTWGVVGNRVRDTCGNAYQARGIEGWHCQWDGSWNSGSTATPSGDANIIAAWNMNNLRVQFGCGTAPKKVTTSGLNYDGVLQWARSNRISIIWGMAGHPTDYPVENPVPETGTPYPEDAGYWRDPLTKAKVAQYKDVIYGIDAMNEYIGPEETWSGDACIVVQWFRNQGYTVPLMVMGPSSGRNLNRILQEGDAIEACDPLRKTIIGWQAYWGPAGTFYPTWQGMTVTQGVAAAALASFPIQIGNAARCDNCDPNQFWCNVDYQGIATTAGQTGLGWQWWDWNSSDFGVSPSASHYPTWRDGLNATGYGFSTAARAPICAIP